MASDKPPPADQLSRLLLGQLPPVETDDLVGTYTDDSRVVPVAEGLPDDTLMESVKQAGTRTDTSAEDLTERLVDRLKADMMAVTQTSAGATGANAAEAMPPTLEYFKLERELGSGGMGTVYLAQDTRLGRPVAIKTLKADLARKPAAKERFFREARVAAALEHESVVPIYYVGEDSGIPFLAMPVLKGRGLDDHLKANGGRLPVADVLRIAAQAAGGLGAAHAVGLIHRDIKPSNLWVDADSRRVRVLDFGLARFETDDLHLTASGVIVGTPAYMAPEQARGRGVDARADLFSLGVVMYQMLTGQRPFTGSDTVSVLSSLALDTPPAPSVVNSDVPAELSDLVMRLLEKEPHNRPASAEVVRAAVERLAVQPTEDRTEIDFSPPKKAVPAAKPKPAPAATRKSPLVPLAVALGLLALLVGGAVAVYQLTFNSKDGTLVVELDDEADVRFKNGKLEVYDDKGVLKYTLTPSEKNKALPPGKYTVRVVGADGVKLDTESFEIERNGKRSVKVTATGPTDVAKKPDPVKPPVPGTPGTGLLLFASSTGAEAPAPALDTQKPWTAEAYFTPLTENLAKTTCRIVGCDEGFGLGIGIEKGMYYAYSRHGHEVGGVVKAGERVHIALVQTATKRMMFLNGKLVGSADNPLPPNKMDVGKVIFSLVNHVPNMPPIDILVEGVRISQAVRYTKDFTPPGRHVPDKETLALYHCDEGQGDKLTDSSGNNLHGKILNAKWGKGPAKPVPPPGAPAGGALRFAEATETSGVEVPTLSIPGKGPFTMEGYVTLKAGQGYVKHRVLFGREYQLALTGQTQPNTTNTASFSLWSGGGGKYEYANADNLPNPTKRFHVACVRTDTEQLLFVDGKQVAESKTIEGSTSGFDIGRKVAADFSEIRVSSVARYKDDFVPAARFAPDKDTVALWHCDDGAGDTLTDSSGNGHHGKVEGGTWVKVQPTTPAVLAPSKPEEIAWLQGLKATLTLRTGPGKDVVLQPTDAPPVEAVTIVGIEFANSSAPDVTDGVLERVAALVDLEVLRCRFEGNRMCAAGKSGLAHLGKLLNLRELHLHRIGTLDTDPKFLERFQKLETLHLGFCPVPAWESRVAKLQTLKKLTLYAMKDAELEKLGPLPGLSEVALNGYSDGQVQRLDSAKKLARVVPWCRIQSDATTVEPSAPPPARTGFAPLDPEWLKAVAALPPEKQVEAVHAELKKRNPKFVGTGEFTRHGIADGVVVELELDGKVTDLTPVRALTGLTKLTAQYRVNINAAPFPLTDLSPLRGTKLTDLDITAAQVTDLFPLEGMPLKSLKLHLTLVRDLTPLAKLPLESLMVAGTQVEDLTPLRGLTRLKHLNVLDTRVTDLKAVTGLPLDYVVTNRLITDLTPLKGMKLKRLETNGPVTDLSVVKGMPLETLWVKESKVTDLSPLEGMPLKDFRFDGFDVARDGKILRSLKSLETINDKPAKDVLK